MVEASQRPVDPLAPPATSTQKIFLTTNGWTDLGQGPLLIQAGGGLVGGVVYAVSSAMPTLIINEGFTFEFGHATVVNTNAHIWAGCAIDHEAWVYVAPISG